MKTPTSGWNEPRVDTCKGWAHVWIKEPVKIHGHRLQCKSIRTKVLRFDLILVLFLDYIHIFIPEFLGRII